MQVSYWGIQILHLVFSGHFRDNSMFGLGSTKQERWHVPEQTFTTASAQTQTRSSAPFSPKGTRPSSRKCRLRDVTGDRQGLFHSAIWCPFYPHKDSWQPRPSKGLAGWFPLTAFWPRMETPTVDLTLPSVCGLRVGCESQEIIQISTKKIKNMS